MNSRIKIYLILFMISGIGAAVVLMKDIHFGSDSGSATKIAVDTAAITKISYSTDSSSVFLALKGKDKWKVNNKFNARENLIKLMMVGLAKAEVKRPVAEENKEKVLKYLSSKGVKVKIEGDEKTVSFLIISNENDANSSYYLAEGSKEPLIIYVPGFSGDMTNLFKLDESGWRSKELFRSNPMTIQNIKVTYPSQPQSSFEIIYTEGRNFRIPGVINMDSTRLFTYLLQYEQVNVDNYITENKDLILEKLKKEKPNAIIELKDIDPLKSKTVLLFGESRVNKGIYCVIKESSELVVIKPETLMRLLVRKELFNKKSS